MRELYDFIKKYCDIFGGIIIGLALSWIAGFKTNIIQLYYSILILILASIGVLRIIKQSIEKNKLNRIAKRKKTLIEKAVDSQKPIKAMAVAQEPTKDGEQLAILFLKLWKGQKRNMKKIKKFFEKFKGYMLTIALTILTILEYIGGIFNDELKQILVVNGVQVLPIITLTAAVIVGMASNGFTKDQWAKIKTLIASSKSSTNDLVQAEIKNQLKSFKSQHTVLSKELVTLEDEYEELNKELTTAQNTLAAKKQMFNMRPQLATDSAVNAAAVAVNAAMAKLNEKKAEIDKKKLTIANIETSIAALEDALN